MSTDAESFPAGTFLEGAQGEALTATWREAHEFSSLLHYVSGEPSHVERRNQHE